MLKGKKYLIIIPAIIILIIICAFLIFNNFNNPLRGTSWSRKTDVDTEYINFNSNGNFSYYFGVGSPVDDYDLCETYTYNEKDMLITLNCDDIGINNKIKIDHIDNNKLILIIDNEKRTFKKVN